MSTPPISLKNILAAISTYKKNNDPAGSIKKRILFNQAPLGGLSSSKFVLFFFALPFLEYAAIFNPIVFNALGIAQSIIFYIVFLSVIMMIIFGLAWINNKKVITKITPMWSSLFPTIDLSMVLSSGHSPYRDFFQAYSLIYNDNLDNDALHKALTKAFDTMREQNKDLLEAMQRNNKL